MNSARSPVRSGGKIPKHPTIIRRHIEARLKEFHPQGPVLAATLVLVQRRCGRPGCHCRKGQGHPTHYLTCKQQGKTRSVYVPQDLLKALPVNKTSSHFAGHVGSAGFAKVRTDCVRRQIRNKVLDATPSLGSRTFASASRMFAPWPARAGACAATSKTKALTPRRTVV